MLPKNRFKHCSRPVDKIMFAKIYGHSSFIIYHFPLLSTFRKVWVVGSTTPLRKFVSSFALSPFLVLVLYMLFEQISLMKVAELHSA